MTTRRVSILAKERALSGAEIDSLLEGSWEGAIHWDRGTRASSRFLF